MKSKTITILLVFTIFASSLTYYLNNSLSYASIANISLEKALTVLKPTLPNKQINLPVIKGLSFNPNRPANIEFFFDTMDQKKLSLIDTQRLIKYFISLLAIPQDKLWVNLSPYQQQRIIPESLEKLDLGKDLLLEDFILKKITAALTDPNTALGKKYWQKVEQITQQITTSNRVNINTFYKVWIVPDKANIYEYVNPTSKNKKITAFVKEAKLKVMMEDDYLAYSVESIAHRKDNSIKSSSALYAKRCTLNAKIKKIFKRELLPIIQEQVNNSLTFAPLRQIYYCLILASYFKQRLNQHPLYSQYIDGQKTQPLNHQLKAKETIYKAYLKTFKDGAYNYLKEEDNYNTHKKTKRHYFSGGASFEPLSQTLEITTKSMINGEIPKEEINIQGKIVKPTIEIIPSLAQTPKINNQVNFLGGWFNNNRDFILTTALIILSIITSNFITTLSLVSGLILGITLHEFSHALTSKLFGDNLAKQSGRVSLNPLAHMSFDQGVKPIPINFDKLTNSQFRLVLLVGPLANIILASFGLYLGLEVFSYLNFLLASLNLLPIKGMDGYGLLYGKKINTDLRSSYNLIPGLSCTAMTLQQNALIKALIDNLADRKQIAQDLADILENFGDTLNNYAKKTDSLSANPDPEDAEHEVKHVVEDSLTDILTGGPVDPKKFEAKLEEEIIKRLKSNILASESPQTIHDLIDKLIITDNKTLIDLIMAWQDRFGILSKAQNYLKDHPTKTVNNAGNKQDHQIPHSHQHGFKLTNILLIGTTILQVVLKYMVLAVTAVGEKNFIDSLDMLTTQEKDLLKDYLIDASELESKPVIGRSKDINKIISVLSKPEKTKNSLLLIGKRGVGKSSLIRLLGRYLKENKAGGFLTGRRLFTLKKNLGSSPREVAGNLANLLPVLTKTRNKVMLFIDEFHALTRGINNTQDFTVADMLKPALEEGAVTIIGATTIGERMQYISQDPAYDDRFEKVVLEEPDEDMALEILLGLKDYFEAKFNIQIEDEALEEMVHLTSRFIPEESLPRKAIDRLQSLISYKVSLIAQKNITIEDMLSTLQSKITRYIRAKKKGTKDDTLDMIVIYNQIIGLINGIVSLIKERDQTSIKVIAKSDVSAFIAENTGIDIVNLTQDRAEKLNNIETELAKSVVGQEKAVRAISNVIRRSHSGLKDSKRPIGVILLAGPTGVGKTQLVKTLTKFLFGNEGGMQRIDLTEYQQEHQVARLYGAPPGYIGYDKGGQLTEAVKKNRYAVILFDELEKAHPKFFEVMFPVFDDGRMTDGQSNVVDFTNTIIFMTSNIGMDILKNSGEFEKFQEKINQAKDEKEIQILLDEMNEKIKISIKEGIKHHPGFSEAFINRLDEVIACEVLRQEDIEKIAKILIKSGVEENLKKEGFSLEIQDSVYTLLAKRGYDPIYGARPLKRTIDRMLNDPLAKYIILEKASKGLTNGGIIKISTKGIDQNAELEFSITPKNKEILTRYSIPEGDSGQIYRDIFQTIEAAIDSPETSIEEKILRNSLGIEKITKQNTTSYGCFKPDQAFAFEPIRTIKSNHNNPNVKDSALKSAQGEITQDISDEEIKNVINNYLDEFTRFAKENNQRESITLAWQKEPDKLLLKITKTPSITDQEKDLLLTNLSLTLKTEEEIKATSRRLASEGKPANRGLIKLKFQLDQLSQAEFGYYADYYWVKLPLKKGETVTENKPPIQSEKSKQEEDALIQQIVDITTQAAEKLKGPLTEELIYILKNEVYPNQSADIEFLSQSIISFLLGKPANYVWLNNSSGNLTADLCSIIPVLKAGIPVGFKLGALPKQTNNKLNPDKIYELSKISLDDTAIFNKNWLKDTIKNIAQGFSDIKEMNKIAIEVLAGNEMKLEYLFNNEKRLLKIIPNPDNTIDINLYDSSGKKIDGTKMDLTPVEIYSVEETPSGFNNQTTNTETDKLKIKEDIIGKEFIAKIIEKTAPGLNNQEIIEQIFTTISFWFSDQFSLIGESDCNQYTFDYKPNEPRVLKVSPKIKNGMVEAAIIAVYDNNKNLLSSSEIENDTFPFIRPQTTLEKPINLSQGMKKLLDSLDASSDEDEDQDQYQAPKTQDFLSSLKIVLTKTIKEESWVALKILFNEYSFISPQDAQSTKKYLNIALNSFQSNPIYNYENALTIFFALLIAELENDTRIVDFWLDYLFAVDNKKNIDIAFQTNIIRLAEYCSLEGGANKNKAAAKLFKKITDRITSNASENTKLNKEVINSPAPTFDADSYISELGLDSLRIEIKNILTQFHKSDKFNQEESTPDVKEEIIISLKGIYENFVKTLLSGQVATYGREIRRNLYDSQGKIFGTGLKEEDFNVKPIIQDGKLTGITLANGQDYALSQSTITSNVQDNYSDDKKLDNLLKQQIIDLITKENTQGLIDMGEIVIPYLFFTLKETKVRQVGNFIIKVLLALGKDNPKILLDLFSLVEKDNPGFMLELIISLQIMGEPAKIIIPSLIERFKTRKFASDDEYTQLIEALVSIGKNDPEVNNLLKNIIDDYANGRQFQIWLYNLLAINNKELLISILVSQVLNRQKDVLIRLNDTAEGIKLLAEIFEKLPKDSDQIFFLEVLEECFNALDIEYLLLVLLAALANYSNKNVCLKAASIIVKKKLGQSQRLLNMIIDLIKKPDRVEELIDILPDIEAQDSDIISRLKELISLLNSLESFSAKGKLITVLNKMQPGHPLVRQEMLRLAQEDSDPNIRKLIEQELKKLKETGIYFIKAKDQASDGVEKLLTRKMNKRISFSMFPWNFSCIINRDDIDSLLLGNKNVEIFGDFIKLSDHTTIPLKFNPIIKDDQVIGLVELAEDLSETQNVVNFLPIPYLSEDNKEKIINNLINSEPTFYNAALEQLSQFGPEIVSLIPELLTKLKEMVANDNPLCKNLLQALIVITKFSPSLNKNLANLIAQCQNPAKQKKLIAEVDKYSLDLKDKILAEFFKEKNKEILINLEEEVFNYLQERSLSKPSESDLLFINEILSALISQDKLQVHALFLLSCNQYVLAINELITKELINKIIQSRRGQISESQITVPNSLTVSRSILNGQEAAIKIVYNNQTILVPLKPILVEKNIAGVKEKDIVSISSIRDNVWVTLPKPIPCLSRSEKEENISLTQEKIEELIKKRDVSSLLDIGSKVLLPLLEFWQKNKTDKDINDFIRQIIEVFDETGEMAIANNLFTKIIAEPPQNQKPDLISLLEIIPYKAIIIRKQVIRRLAKIGLNDKIYRNKLTNLLLNDPIVTIRQEIIAIFEKYITTKAQGSQELFSMLIHASTTDPDSNLRITLSDTIIRIYSQWPDIAIVMPNQIKILEKLLKNKLKGGIDLNLKIIQKPDNYWQKEAIKSSKNQNELKNFLGLNFKIINIEEVSQLFIN